MSDTVVIDGDMLLKIPIDGDPALNIPIDGDPEAFVKIAGLEYETGFCAVSSASASMTIPFYKSHTKAPFFCALICNSAQTGSLAYHSIMSPYYLYGNPVTQGSRTAYAYRYAVAVGSSFEVTHLNSYCSTLNALETILDNEKWVATTIHTSYRFGSQNSYKYIAVWAPES